MGAVKFTAISDRTRASAWISGFVKSPLTDNTPPTIDTLAQQQGYSIRGLQHRLSEEGTSFRELMTQTRKSLSETLMDQGESLATIAFTLGFDEFSSFNRWFKKAFGMTPSAYRTR
jgi:AraC-like DNA-binding protein